MVIEVKQVTKHFEAFTALKGLNLQVHPGELVALLGGRVLDADTAASSTLDTEEFSSTVIMEVYFRLLKFPGCLLFGS